MPFGNVKVAYSPCKLAGQLKAAADYMLGKSKEQIEKNIVKTAPDLYSALGCSRDNFVNSILVTRKLQNKSYSKHKENTILAHKMSISFHPDDNLNYQMAFEIAKEFAEKFMKEYEVLFAVHTDSKHIHAHFLVRIAIFTRVNLTAEISVICTKCRSFSASNALNMVLKIQSETSSIITI